MNIDEILDVKQEIFSPSTCDVLDNIIVRFHTTRTYHFTRKVENMVCRGIYL